MAAPEVMKPIDKVALKFLGPDLFHALSENKALEAKFEMLLMVNIAVIILIVIMFIYHLYKMHEAKKAAAANKSTFDDGHKSTGVMVLPYQSGINRISGTTVSAHQGSVAAGGLFEHDTLTVQQNAPMMGEGKPKLHCAPDEIEGISLVTDAQTGEQIRVVNCYDSAGVLQPPRPRRASKYPHPIAQPKVEPDFSQTPTMDCNGVWDYGAEGELGAQGLMGNVAPDPYAMMGARKFDSELMSLE